jgi:hypothetical protein
MFGRCRLAEQRAKLIDLGNVAVRHGAALAVLDGACRLAHPHERRCHTPPEPASADEADGEKADADRAPDEHVLGRA